MATVESIPLSAFRFDASVSSIEAYETEGSISADIKILARSNKPINHWYWGKIVHDMEGVRHKDRLTLDYCHDEDQIIVTQTKSILSTKVCRLAGSLFPSIKATARRR